VSFNFKEMLFKVLTKNWNWDMDQAFNMVNVEKDSDEFSILESGFDQHMRYYGSAITEVKRVQNLDLLSKYIEKYMEVMMKPQNNNKTIERRMYHGCPEEHINKILREGLDYRLAKATGSLGQSAYFGDSPITSLNYIDLNKNEKVMLVCRVIVGTSVKGRHGLKRPPHIYKTLDLADSVYGDLGHDRIYGIFDLDQILVEYLIKFRIDDNKIKCLKLKNHMTQSNANLSISGNIDMNTTSTCMPKIDVPNTNINSQKVNITQSNAIPVNEPGNTFKYYPINNKDILINNQHYNNCNNQLQNNGLFSTIIGYGLNNNNTYNTNESLKGSLNEDVIPIKKNKRANTKGYK